MGGRERDGGEILQVLIDFTSEEDCHSKARKVRARFLQRAYVDMSEGIHSPDAKSIHVEMEGRNACDVRTILRMRGARP